MTGEWTCAYVIEGPRARTGPGRGKPWWRRQCKRKVEHVGDRCWQHRAPS